MPLWFHTSFYFTAPRNKTTVEADRSRVESESVVIRIYMQIIDESDPLDCEEIFRLKKKKVLHAWNDILPLLVEGWFDVEGPQDTRDIDEQRIECKMDTRAWSAAKTEG